MPLVLFSLLVLLVINTVIMFVVPFSLFIRLVLLVIDIVIVIGIVIVKKVKKQAKNNGIKKNFFNTGWYTLLAFWTVILQGLIIAGFATGDLVLDLTFFVFLIITYGPFLWYFLHGVEDSGIVNLGLGDWILTIICSPGFLVGIIVFLILKLGKFAIMNAPSSSGTTTTTTDDKNYYVTEGYLGKNIVDEHGNKVTGVDSRTDDGTYLGNDGNTYKTKD